MVVVFEDELDSFNVYEKLENQSFKQVVNHLSGTGSKDAIMDEFDSLFSDLYGSWIWKVVKQNDESIWLSVVSYIDLWLNSKSNNVKKTMSIALNISNTCDDHINMTLSQRLKMSHYASQVKLQADKLRIDLNLIKSIFDNNFKKINSCIKYVLTRSEEKEVNTIILAGNIANCPLLKCAIVTEFPNKQIFAIENSEHAALKGAVLFGHAPVVVSSIFCGAQVMVSR
ncbi:Hypothetical predicted protein [Mytilus galloprovincialis]|uniref:Uncharacterized protein n=1 Tax=Mytilus galloprovincialis TaxID=29158 RepID=A0A8B6CXC8_MYTGA|nr:Hypothetical predicted protein [Mytilus galloprovincialis]